jgi:hypothetical protein
MASSVMSSLIIQTSYRSSRALAVHQSLAGCRASVCQRQSKRAVHFGPQQRATAIGTSADTIFVSDSGGDTSPHSSHKFGDGYWSVMAPLHFRNLTYLLDSTRLFYHISE